MEELLYVEISNKIENQIREGQLRENDKLSERGLAEDNGVSRTVVRDALKLLNEKGFVVIKSGKGHYVRIPDEKDLIGKIEYAIDYSEISIQQIVEARELMECSMVDLILSRKSECDILELKKIYKNMSECIESDEGVERYVKLDELFHITMLGIVHNSVLQIFTRTLNGMINREVFLGNKYSVENAHKDHGKMLQALINNDKIELLKAFDNHIRCIREQI